MHPSDTQPARSCRFPTTAIVLALAAAAVWAFLAQAQGEGEAAGTTPSSAADRQQNRQYIRPLSVAVIKATTGLCLKGETCHKDRAGVWTPQTGIAILGVAVAEQADIDLYTDLEISTRPEMYQCNGNDSDGCVYRAKYAGPGLFDYSATSGTTYLGSNITTTSMTFPAGYGIVVQAGTPIYIHLDVRNGSMIDLSVDQDAWLYYVPL